MTKWPEAVVYGVVSLRPESYFNTFGLRIDVDIISDSIETNPDVWFYVKIGISATSYHAIFVIYDGHVARRTGRFNSLGSVAIDPSIELNGHKAQSLDGERYAEFGDMIPCEELRLVLDREIKKYREALDRG